MRTISNLLNQEGRVYVYLGSTNIAQRFLSQAEAEGFTFNDGVKPTERHISDIYALNRSWTINYVGWAGHMAFQSADSVNGEPLIRVNYGKYLSGSENYIMGKSL